MVAAALPSIIGSVGAGGVAAGTAGAAAAGGIGAAAAGGGLAGGLSGASGLSGLIKRPGLQIPQQSALTRAGGGGINNPGSPLRQSFSHTQNFDKNFMSSDQAEKAGNQFDAVGGGLQEGFQQMSSGLSGFGNGPSALFMPQRPIGQWQPNSNPGLAGLMQQLQASHRGGLGR